MVLARLGCGRRICCRLCRVHVRRVGVSRGHIVARRAVLRSRRHQGLSNGRPSGHRRSQESIRLMRKSRLADAVWTKATKLLEARHRQVDLFLGGAVLRELTRLSLVLALADVRFSLFLAASPICWDVRQQQPPFWLLHHQSLPLPSTHPHLTAPSNTPSSPPRGLFCIALDSLLRCAAIDSRLPLRDGPPIPAA